MKKTVLFLTACLFMSAPAWGQGIPQPLDFGPKEPLTIVSGQTVHAFNVEVADTPEEQARGLMFRERLPNEEGMLFEFADVKVANIWMKNTGIPLDIIFVRKNGQILKIEHYAKPYSLRNASSEAPVAAVLEIIGGRSEELGIRPGDLVRHEFFGTAETE